MLLIQNYTAEHIRKLQVKTKADPSILKRTIFAFRLLEALSKVGLDFIFKGGTSLLVSLKRPKRLSTDIDIIAKPGADIDSYIMKAGCVFPFLGVEEQIRQRANKIEKRHFKFRFLSPRGDREISVLLDVVFEENPYVRLKEVPIRSEILLNEGKDLFVKVPSKNCLLGDKLTAFAPHSIGIPFGVGKELEIIKQMFDCWTLFQEMDDYPAVKETYEMVSRIELAYRSLQCACEDCLKDTIDSCLCLLGRGAIRPNDYSFFSSGINAIQGHLIGLSLNGESAGRFASEIMYLATHILTKKESVGENRFGRLHKRERADHPRDPKNPFLAANRPAFLRLHRAFFEDAQRTRALQK